MYLGFIRLLEGISELTSIKSIVKLASRKSLFKIVKVSSWG